MADVSAAEIAKVHGMTPRHWTRLAAAGKVPGAWQSAGTGGKWLFDPLRFAEWKAEQMKGESLWPASIDVGAHGGRGLNATAASSGKALKHRIDELLSAAIATGSKGSTRSPGATGRGGASPKPSNVSSLNTARR